MEEQIPPISSGAPVKPAERLREWARRHKPALIVGIPLVALVIISAIIWFGNAKPVEEVIPTKPQPKVAEEPKELPSLLNGVMLPRDIYNRHPVAVMIENSPSARPQTGLTGADIVYEAVTEGGITRFMGVFSSNLPTKAGPVRSARSYFIDYLSEYDAFYAHAGGSPTALARIGEYGIKDYPHSSDAYWREARKGVASEHTLFTDVAKIFKFGVEKRGWPATIDFKPWLFKDASATPGPAVAVKINFSTPQFNVIWNFDPATKLYSRTLGGTAHKDALSGEQITATTIITISVNHSPNPPYRGTGKESEWTMGTIGGGKAVVFQDGIVTEGTWKKPSRVERTRLYTAEGKEIELNRGKIWFEVIPQEGSVTQV